MRILDYKKSHSYTSTELSVRTEKARAVVVIHLLFILRAQVALAGHGDCENVLQLNNTHNTYLNMPALI